MNEKGQVFTTDMIFALLLTAAFISVSGQAYAIATGKIRSYSTRYSLERIANDTADVLVNTPGRPNNWETHPENLETLGLIRVGADNEPLRNYMDTRKLSRFASEILSDNWDPNNEKQDQAIMNFFGLGEFIDNFGLKLIDNGETIWNIWPGKEPGETSPAENALEVATVNRIVYGGLVYVAGESPPVTHRVTIPATHPSVIPFWIYSGELKSYDWYVYVENTTDLGSGFNVGVTINENTGPGQTDYDFKKGGGGNNIDIPGWAPAYGVEGIEEDTLDHGQQLENDALNHAYIYITGNKFDYVKVYIVAIPSGENPNIIPDAIEERPFRLQLSVWR